MSEPPPRLAPRKYDCSVWDLMKKTKKMYPSSRMFSMRGYVMTRLFFFFLLSFLPFSFYNFSGSRTRTRSRSAR
jgi:hypothetical protein